MEGNLFSGVHGQQEGCWAIPYGLRFSRLLENLLLDFQKNRDTVSCMHILYGLNYSSSIILPEPQKT